MTQQEFISIQNNPIMLTWYGYSEKCSELNQEVLVRPDNFMQLIEVWYERTYPERIPFRMWAQKYLVSGVEEIIIPYLKTKIT